MRSKVTHADVVFSVTGLTMSVSAMFFCVKCIYHSLLPGFTVSNQEQRERNTTESKKENTEIVQYGSSPHRHD